jgi:hypothetical protein
VKKTTTNNKYAAEKDKICTASGVMRGNLGPLQLVLYTSKHTEHCKQARARADGGGTSERDRPAAACFIYKQTHRAQQAGARPSRRRGHVRAREARCSLFDVQAGARRSSRRGHVRAREARCSLFDVRAGARRSSRRGHVRAREARCSLFDVRAGARRSSRRGHVPAREAAQQQQLERADALQRTVLLHAQHVEAGGAND